MRHTIRVGWASQGGKPMITSQPRLLFPVRYEVRSASIGRQSGEIMVAAPHGRAVRLLALEEIRRRCGVLPQKLEVGVPR